MRAGVSSRWRKDLLLRCDDGGSHACCPVDVVGADDDGPDLDIFSGAPSHAQTSAEDGFATDHEPSQIRLRFALNRCGVSGLHR